ncbi:DUF1947 domain-containing protein [Candidatus Venteria ishoeyi]|uniref:H/ACA RNA-protein complex component Cbf5p n=1 Tax=Candidatus Venteria ishoeyi TaxID=1899563 RepID=A0A1H6F7E9_9GAMM|nr:DUF1947 domain-containing protein [Candidatus Venteria ishoeyi]SEH05463.1 H/ACA RNA-protein complex component Cbf5p [Candidatus Venteria ishoeyi]
MARRQYSKSDIKKLDLPIEISKKANIAEEDDKLVIDNKVSFLKYEENWFPHLKLLLTNSSILPKVTVDMGAVKFVVNGADIMRPGITNIEDFDKGAFVVVIDETHEKPLSVCKTLFSAEEMRNQSSGKVLKNLHYIGDEFWNL